MKFLLSAAFLFFTSPAWAGPRQAPPPPQAPPMEETLVTVATPAQAPDVVLADKETCACGDRCPLSACEGGAKCSCAAEKVVVRSEPTYRYVPTYLPAQTFPQATFSQPSYHQPATPSYHQPATPSYQAPVYQPTYRPMYQPAYLPAQTFPQATFSQPSYQPAAFTPSFRGGLSASSFAGSCGPRG